MINSSVIPTKREAMFQAAQEYFERVWTVIPVPQGKKKAAARWKGYQKKRPGLPQLKRWFLKADNNIGVIMGDASDGLVCRDFDHVEEYDMWAAQCPKLAATLPTGMSGRGYHVFATASLEHVRDVRMNIGKSGGTGDIKVQRGELRCDLGCYTILPPSWHPNGRQYQWKVPLTAEKPPEIDIFDALFYVSPLTTTHATESTEENREHRGAQRAQKRTEEIEGEKKKHSKTNPDSEPLTWGGPVHEAIIDSIPDGPGKRHRQVFELARGLKAIPELADKKAGELRLYVKAWHEQSIDNIATKPFTETWIDFLKAWPRVKYPKGEDLMTAIFERASLQPIPEVAQEYDQRSLQLLVALCRELQRSAGDGPFYLSCRTAGRLLGIDHTTASRWLFLMCSDGILEVAGLGDRARLIARRYRYLGEL